MAMCSRTEPAEGGERRCELVVAWHSEDVSWVREAGLGPVTTLYAKGAIEPTDAEQLAASLGLQAADGVVRLPNVGRESHTYLHHIVSNYDRLADVTFFAQGRTDDHCNDLPGVVLRHWTGVEDALLVRSPGGRRRGMVGLGGWRIPLDEELRCGRWTEDGRALTARMFADLFEDPPPPGGTISFTAGAIFAATREAVRSRSVTFWRRCLAYVDREVNPLAGFAFERLWEPLFDAAAFAAREAP